MDTQVIKQDTYMVRIYLQFRQVSFVLDNLLNQYDQEKEKRDNLFETPSSTMDQFGSSCNNISHITDTLLLSTHLTYTD